MSTGAPPSRPLDDADPHTGRSPGELSTLVAVGVLTLALVAMYASHQWPLWPALACPLSGLAARAVALRARRTAAWPSGLSGLLGLCTGLAWVVLTRALGTGLEPALPSLARAAVLPALALGPILIARAFTAAAPFATTHSAAMVLGACVSLLESGGPIGSSAVTLWTLGLTIAVVSGVAPVVLALFGRPSPHDLSLASAGLLFASCCGAPAMATVWAERELRDPAIYRPSRATVEDLQDAYAVFPAKGGSGRLLMLCVPNADLRTGENHIEAYTVTGQTPPGAAPLGSIFSAHPAAGYPDVVGAPELSLVQIGTRAKPLSSEPIHLTAVLTRSRAAFTFWPSAAGMLLALLACVGSSRWPGPPLIIAWAPLLTALVVTVAWATPGRPMFAVALAWTPLLMRLVVPRRSRPLHLEVPAIMYALLVIDLGRG